MYKKILIPTDGSALSLAAAVKGVEFAQQIGASVVGFHAPEEYQYPVYMEASLPYAYPTPAEYKQSMQKAAERYLAYIHDAAGAAGVGFESMVQFNNATTEAIIKAAKKKNCDLIFMGSHGRSGLSKLFLGSVANKVLASCTIPVLIHRTTKQELAEAEKYLKQTQKIRGKPKFSAPRPKVYMTHDAARVTT